MRVHQSDRDTVKEKKNIISLCGSVSVLVAKTFIKYYASERKIATKVNKVKVVREQSDLACSSSKYASQQMMA
jgi:hypothetical protein